MKTITERFSFNIPAEYTTTGSPDRFVNVTATVDVYSTFEGEQMGRVNLVFEIDDYLIAELYKPMNIYRESLTLAEQRIKAKLVEPEPDVNRIAGRDGWVEGLGVAV